MLQRVKRDTQQGIDALGALLKVALCFALMVLLLLMNSCNTGIEPTSEAQDNAATSASQTVSARYLVNVRNSTDEERLSNTVINVLMRNGFSYSQRFDYDTGRAYAGDYPMQLRGTFIVIPQDREDLREIAWAIREVLDVGAIIEESSNVDGWRYSGDILLVLGDDCLISSKKWVLWPSDHQDFSENQGIKYWVTIRNATTQNLLADSTMRLLDSAGFNFEEGYSYALGNAYQGNTPLRLQESSIVIKENREDLLEIAEAMREVIGVGTITELNSGANWTYDDDILIVLGSDSK